MNTNIESLVTIRNFLLIAIGISVLIYAVAYIIIIRKRRKAGANRLPLNDMDPIETQTLSKKVQFTFRIYNQNDKVLLRVEQNGKNFVLVDQAFELGMHFYTWEQEEDLDRTQSIFVVFESGKNKITRKYNLA